MTRFPCKAAIALCGVFALGACATQISGPDSTPEQARAAAYSHDGPPAISLFTMVANRSGYGAHTSLLVNGSQRVIFDPAGSVQFSVTPEIGDVLYGATPQVVEAYETAHARETYHARIQRIEVSPEVAEKALSLVLNQGEVTRARCTIVTAQILQQLPGFEGIGISLLPNGLSQDFATLPGVTTRHVFDTDSDDKSIAVAAFDRAQAAQP